MRFLFTLLFILNVFVGYSQDGLQFISNDQPKKNRSQVIFLEDSFIANDSLIISFQFSVYNKLFIGDILNIKNTVNNSTVSLNYDFTYSTDNKPYLKLNLKGIKNLLEIQIPDDYVEFEKWMNVKLKINYSLNQLELTFLNQTSVIENLFKEKNSLVNIVFGQNEFNDNVPAFNLKDLRILTENKNVYFPFSEKKGTIVNAKNNNIKAKIKNPLWVAESYKDWKLITQLELDSNHNVVYDSSQMRFIILGENNSYDFNVVSTIISNNSYNNPSKFHSYTSGKAFLNTETNKILMLQTGEPNASENKFLNKKLGVQSLEKDSKDQLNNTYSLGSINSSSNTWKNLYSYNILEQPLFNFNTHYDYLSNSLLIFGGYSDFKFRNDFLKFNFNTNVFDKIIFSGDNISPRYMSGMSLTKKNSLLVYGGEGNLSGDENIGKIPFYDLFEINLNEGSINRLWKKSFSYNHNSISENLILNDPEDYFYCLVYNGKEESINLKKVSVENGDEIYLGGKINFNTSILANNFNLFYEQKNNKLYAYTKEFSDNRLEKNLISFYSIEMEPLLNELFKKEKAELSESYIDLKWIGLILFIIIFLIILILIFKKISIKSTVAKTKKDYIFVRSDRSDVKLFFVNVIALEAMKDYTKIITKENSYMVHGNISNFITKFPQNKFVRIHRSTVINVDFITSFESNTVNLGRHHYTIGGKYTSIIKKYLN